MKRKNFVCMVGLSMSMALSALELKVECASPGTWRIATERVASGVVEEFVVRMKSPAAAVPPRFSVSFDLPQVDAHHKWVPYFEQVTLPPNWGGRTESRLCKGIPLVAYLNDSDRNRACVAVSEASRTVKMQSGLREEDCHLVWNVDFFSESEAAISEYEVAIRIDRRDVFFGDAIREGTAWIERRAGLRSVDPPAAAFDPFYSTWYSFHQGVFDHEIEAECAEAAKLGMKVVIVDDGWQTDDTNRGYAYTGDWEVSRRRFPDMAAHVARVHALGMKYMIWYGVPMMGVKAKNYDQFRGKYLWTLHDRGAGYSCLDPRFPDVRAYLCDLYEKAMRDWGLDGLKLDFIDSFGFRGEDPAVKENYAGRDITALPEAVDRLMREVYARVTAVRPDALIEFRQCYIGPAVRQYGNMLRAADCPGDLLANRARTANLRLTSGATAVHADMLEWNVSDTPENAARFILSAMFSTIQYSMMLRTLPADHKRMVTHWLDFSREHRHALLKGWFRPHHYEANYPWIEAGDETETVIGCYQSGAVIPVPDEGKPVYVFDGTGTGDLILEFVGRTRLQLYDTYGETVGEKMLPAGLHHVILPRSGYMRATAERK